MRIPSLLLVLGGCPWVRDADVDALADADRDGEAGLAFGGADCDDADPAVIARALYADADRDGHGDPAVPSAGCATVEGLSLLADDCDDADPAVGAPQLRFLDRDGDGSGGAEGSESCPAPGLVPTTGDCDDADPERYPDDRDGDGESPCGQDCDDADPAVIRVERFEDVDGDGVGNAERPTGSCTEGVVRTGDCDDIDETVRGEVDTFDDADGDGDGAGEPVGHACPGTAGVAFTDTDCDDADPDVNDLDLDGDGVSGCSVPADCDDRDPAAQLEFLAYGDGDGDGFGAGAPARTCGFRQDIAFLAGDCDDRDAAVSPAEAERCGGFGDPRVDEDCSGVPDDGLDEHRYAPDADGDGWPGAAEATFVHCTPVLPAGHVAVAGDLPVDCAPLDPDVHPETTFYADDDGDGFGVGPGGAVRVDCLPPPGFVADGTDCDDGDPTRTPESLWFLDRDGDGFAIGESPERTCTPPPLPGAWTLALGDCDPADPDAHPGAEEPDGADRDCDGLLAEEDPTLCPWTWRDDDGDGWGRSDEVPVRSCDLDGAALRPGDLVDLSDQQVPTVRVVATEAELLDALGEGAVAIAVTLAADVVLTAPLRVEHALVVDADGHRLRGRVEVVAGTAVWLVDGTFGDGVRSLSAGALSRVGVADAALEGGITAEPTTSTLAVVGGSVTDGAVAVAAVAATLRVKIKESRLDAPVALDLDVVTLELRDVRATGAVVAATASASEPLEVSDLDVVSRAPDRAGLRLGAAAGVRITRTAVSARGTALEVDAGTVLDRVSLASAEGHAIDPAPGVVVSGLDSTALAAPGRLVSDGSGVGAARVDGFALWAPDADPGLWDLHLRDDDLAHGAWPDDESCRPDGELGITCRVGYVERPPRAPLGWLRTWFGVTDEGLLGFDLGATDSDLDGVTNDDEYAAGTHPLASDTDRDGLGDDVDPLRP